MEPVGCIRTGSICRGHGSGKPQDGVAAPRLTREYVAWAGETGYTFGQLFHSPLLVLKMCYNTLAWQGEQLYSGMIGGALGNMDAVLNTPYAVILGLTAILVMLALRKPGESIFHPMEGPSVDMVSLPGMPGSADVLHAAGLDAGELQCHKRCTGKISASAAPHVPSQP